MSKCFVCGISFSGSANELLRLKKKEYEQHGIERYFYRLGKDKEVMICLKKDFNQIYETQIKPILDNDGVEYAHIKEYGTKSI